jgi:hypothetical protein
MKLRKPNWKEFFIMITLFLLFFLIFHFWDELKAVLGGIFN